MTHSASSLVVIGGSAGAIAPMTAILESLPADFPAAVIIVLHASAESPGLLPEVVGRRAAMPVRLGRDDERLTAGCVYVAPPDRHMLVAGRRLKCVRGPRENRARPAIDPTMRTAANAYGRALTAVLLSGMLSDGTYGLAVAAARGATTVVQDPDSAECPEMPRNALERVRVDHVLAPLDIARLLEEVVRREVTAMESESDKANNAPDRLERLPRPSLQQPPDGDQVPFVCPDCGGALWETREAGMWRFRCHVGHAFNDDVLLDAQSETVETALWQALRALEEKVELAGRMAARARASGAEMSARRFEEDARDISQQAEVVFGLLTRAPRPAELADHRG